MQKMLAFYGGLLTAVLYSVMLINVFGTLLVQVVNR